MTMQAGSTDSARRATERPQAEIRLLPAVIATEWFIIFALLVIGLGLVMLHTTPSLQSHPVLIAILEHLGLGLIVASMVVLVFEWRSRSRQLSDSPLTAELIEQTKDLKEVRDTLISAKGPDSLERVLNLMLPTDPDPEYREKYRDELIKNVLLLVESMPRLIKVGIWAPHFIAELLKVVVVNNASRLSHLDESGDQAFATPPTGAAVADMILAAQMETLNEGDSYEVISHLTAWKDRQLTKLQEATRSASAKGVRVRRIFNLSKENYTLTVDPGEAKLYLQNHLRDMNNFGPGKYEVKVFFPDDGEKVPEFRNDMRRAHFGIFTRQGQKLRVEVTNENLASMKMSKLQDDFQMQSELFKAVWDALDTKLNDDVIDRVVTLCSTGHSVAGFIGIEPREGILK